MAYNGSDIFKRMNANPATTATLDAAQQASDNLRTAHKTLAEKIQSIQTKIDGYWEGESADAAKYSLGPIIMASEVAASDLEISKDALSDQSTAFHGAKNSLRPMEGGEPATSFLTDTLSPWDTAQEDKANAWKANNEHNIAQYRSYSDSTSSNAGVLPLQYPTFGDGPGGVPMVDGGGTGVERRGTATPQVGGTGGAGGGTGTSGYGGPGSVGGYTPPVGGSGDSPGGGGSAQITPPSQFTPPQGTNPAGVGTGVGPIGTGAGSGSTTPAGYTSGSGTGSGGFGPGAGGLAAFGGASARDRGRGAGAGGAAAAGGFGPVGGAFGPTGGGAGAAGGSGQGLGAGARAGIGGMPATGTPAGGGIAGGAGGARGGMGGGMMGAGGGRGQGGEDKEHQRKYGLDSDDWFKPERDEDGGILRDPVTGMPVVPPVIGE